MLHTCLVDAEKCVLLAVWRRPWTLMEHGDDREVIADMLKDKLHSINRRHHIADEWRRFH